MAMKNLRASMLALSGLFASHVFGQFPLVNTSAQSIFVLGSLSSGMRYAEPFYPVDGAAGTRTIYNLDLTVHRVLNYPAPPTGMRWANMGYITETLFDTDPLTIEFTMVAQPISSPGNFAAFVVREDASVLFSQNPGNFTNGPFFVSAYGPIFSTPEGTFMTVHTYGVNGGPVNIFQLPGTLPCMDCYGTPDPDGIVMGGVINNDPASGMILLPNPAQHEVHIRFSNRDTQVDQVSVTDASGRMVLRSAVNSKDLTVISVGQLANGRYTVTATQGERPIGSLPLMIAR